MSKFKSVSIASINEKLGSMKAVEMIESGLLFEEIEAYGIREKLEFIQILTVSGLWYIIFKEI